MPKAELKTKKTALSAAAFLAAIADPDSRRDAQALCKLMQDATGEKPKMWGAAMVGFGDYRYARRDGSQHDFFRVGFSPRKTNLTVYGLLDQPDAEARLKTLGPFKRGQGCLYLNGLKGVHLPTLKALIVKGYKGAKMSEITSDK